MQVNTESEFSFSFAPEAQLALGFPRLGPPLVVDVNLGLCFHFSYISWSCPSVLVKSCTMGLRQESHRQSWKFRDADSLQGSRGGH